MKPISQSVAIELECLNDRLVSSNSGAVAMSSRIKSLIGDPPARPQSNPGARIGRLEN